MNDNSANRVPRTQPPQKGFTALRDAFRTATSTESQHTGHDETGSIAVTVDGRNDVTAVNISHAWEREIPASMLGMALTDAYHAAIATSLTAFADRLDEIGDFDLDEDATMDTSNEVALPSSDTWHPATQQEIDDILTRFKNEAEEIEQITRRTSHDQGKRKVGVRGPLGLANAVVQGGDIVEIVINHNRLQRGQTSQLERDIVEALRQARRLLG